MSTDSDNEALSRAEQLLRSTINDLKAVASKARGVRELSPHDSGRLLEGLVALENNVDALSTTLQALREHTTPPQLIDHLLWYFNEMLTAAFKIGQNAEITSDTKKLMAKEQAKKAIEARVKTSGKDERLMVARPVIEKALKEGTKPNLVLARVNKLLLNKNLREITPKTLTRYKQLVENDIPNDGQTVSVSSLFGTD